MNLLKRLCFYSKIRTLAMNFCDHQCPNQGVKCSGNIPVDPQLHCKLTDAVWGLYDLHGSEELRLTARNNRLKYNRRRQLARSWRWARRYRPINITHDEELERLREIGGIKNEIYR